MKAHFSETRILTNLKLIAEVNVLTFSLDQIVTKPSKRLFKKYTFGYNSPATINNNRYNRYVHIPETLTVNIYQVRLPYALSNKPDEYRPIINDYLTQFYANPGDYAKVEQSDVLTYAGDYAQMNLMPFMVFTNTKSNMPFKGFVDSEGNCLSTLNINKDASTVLLKFPSHASYQDADKSAEFRKNHGTLVYNEYNPYVDDASFDYNSAACPLGESTVKFGKSLTVDEMLSSDRMQNIAFEPNRTNNDNANGILSTDLQLSGMFYKARLFDELHLSSLTYVCRDNYTPASDVELSIYNKETDEFIFKSTSAEISGQDYIFKFEDLNNEGYEQYEISAGAIYRVQFNKQLNLKVFSDSKGGVNTGYHFGNASISPAGYVYAPSAVMYEEENHFIIDDIVLLEAEDKPGYVFKGWYTRNGSFIYNDKFTPENNDDPSAGYCTYPCIFPNANYSGSRVDSQRDQLRNPDNYTVLLTKDKKLPILKKFMNAEENGMLAACEYRYIFNSSFGSGSKNNQKWSRGPIRRNIPSSTPILQRFNDFNLWGDGIEISTWAALAPQNLRFSVELPTNIEATYFEGDIYRFNLLMAKYAQVRRITFEVELEDRFGVFANSSDVIKNDIPEVFPENEQAFEFDYLPVVDLGNGKHKYSAYVQIELDADEIFRLERSYIYIQHPNQNIQFDGWISTSGKIYPTYRMLKTSGPGWSIRILPYEFDDSITLKPLFTYDIYIPKKPGIKICYDREGYRTIVLPENLDKPLYDWWFYMHEDSTAIEKDGKTWFRINSHYHPSSDIYYKKLGITDNNVYFRLNTTNRRYLFFLGYGCARKSVSENYVGNTYDMYFLNLATVYKPAGLVERKYDADEGNPYCRELLVLHSTNSYGPFENLKIPSYANPYNIYYEMGNKTFVLYFLENADDIYPSFYYASFNKHINDQQQYDLLSCGIPCDCTLDIVFDDMYNTLPVSIDYDVYAYTRIYASEDISGFKASVYDTNGQLAGYAELSIAQIPSYESQGYWYKEYNSRESYYANALINHYASINIPTGYTAEIVAVPFDSSKSTNATPEDPIVVDLVDVPDNESDALALINGLYLELQEGGTVAVDRHAYEIAFDSLFLFQEQQKKLKTFDQTTYPVKMQEKKKNFVPYCRISCYNDLVIDLRSTANEFSMVPDNTGYLIPISGDVDYALAYDATYSNAEKDVYEYSDMSVVFFNNSKNLIIDETDNNAIQYSTSTDCSVSFTSPSDAKYAQVLFGCQKDISSDHEYTTFTNVFFGFRSTYENCNFTDTSYERYQPNYNGNAKTPRWYGIMQSIGSTYGSLQNLPIISSSVATDHFNGWKKYDDGKDVHERTPFISSNMSLMSYWISESDDIWTKVVLNPNGGKLSSPRNAWKDVHCFSAYGQLPQPTRLGYSFVGWSTSPLGGQTISSSTIVQTAYQHMLYAQWSNISDDNMTNVNILLHTLGGYLSDDTSYDFIQREGVYGLTCDVLSCNADELPTALRREDPLNSKYDSLEFDGWYESMFGGERLSGEVSLQSGNLYARWKPKMITLTFDLNDTYLQTFSPVSPRQVIARSMLNFDKVKPAFRYGYKFDGWYDESGAKASGNVLVGKTDQKFTAHWMKVEGAGDNAAQRIRISKAFKLELNGGTLDAGYGQLCYFVGLGKALPTAAQVSNGEKTFGGWYLSNTFDGDAFTSIPDYYNTTNVKFYAKWIDENEEEES